ncbi:hypothetical protein AXG93_1162s1080 [Marchantia polymorpha subsp. ruderalis]|uniref:Uncharacterized protein n=1 Tax=Marchantia polymorpha subsp. ruderalis TaxID=1480154 RepID=A0A176WSH7_MARPO|nr:hypothetical protein AXG93_1162s1080 [Marchantia polymorpha subsp. ruderalis]
MRPSGGSGKEATNVRSLRVCLCHVRAGNEYEAPPETRPPWVCQESSLYRNVLQPDVSPPFYGVPQPDKMRTSKEPFDNRKITKELPYNQIDSRASDSRNEGLADSADVCAADQQDDSASKLVLLKGSPGSRKRKVTGGRK